MGRYFVGVAFVSAVLGIATFGCGSSQESDVLEIVNVSYDPTRELYAEINEAFVAEHKAKTGQIARITQSHGGSGAQARAVIDGLRADVVSLALAGDIDAIAARGGLATDWQTRLPSQSSPYTSTINFLVRAGNPKGIKDWSDLTRPDVQVITPNPKISGGARWNFLAAWGYVTLHQKGSETDAEEFLRKLFRNVPKLDTGARGSTETFVRRKLGDVYITWENEGQFLIEQFKDEKFEIVYPTISILAEPPVAVVDSVVDQRGTRALAEQYLKFLYTDAAQKIIGRHGYRPSSANGLKQFAPNLPSLKMFSIRDVAGSWADAQTKFFADGGVFDRIYQPASK